MLELVITIPCSETVMIASWRRSYYKFTIIRRMYQTIIKKGGNRHPSGQIRVGSVLFSPISVYFCLFKVETSPTNIKKILCASELVFGRLKMEEERFEGFVFGFRYCTFRIFQFGAEANSLCAYGNTVH